MKLTFRKILLAIGLTVSAANSQAALYHADITIDPALYSSTSLTAPFLLDFQLNSGGGLSPVSNSVTLSNFAFLGSGGAVIFGASTMTGSASGDLSTAVTLTDDATNAFSEFYQSFSNGVTQISFNIDTTTNVNSSAPDLFAVALLDSSAGFPQISTTDPLGVSLITLTLNNPIAMGAYSGIGIDGAVSAVPLPGAVWLFGSALVTLVGAHRRKRVSTV
jgi:hypothetical protein